ncbi:hypothetical protein DRQ11_15295, partial [candidate division KSB1 bacterium]
MKEKQKKELWENPEEIKTLLKEFEEYKKTEEFKLQKNNRNKIIKEVQKEFKKWKEKKSNPESTYEKIMNNLGNVYTRIQRKKPKNKKTFLQDIDEILEKAENNKDWKDIYINLVHKSPNNIGEVKATALLFALNNEKFCFVLNDDVQKVIKKIMCKLVETERIENCSKYPCFLKIMKKVKDNLEIGDSVDFDIFLWWLKEREDEITINNAFLPEDYLKDLLVSVLAKPFVILAGITGTGKSLVAKEFAKAICAKHILIPVRPDWTDSSGLLGYKNVFTNQWVSTPFLEFILAADKDKDTPYVAILDEMNLARVEYYFSDFLSVLEDKERRTSGMNIEKLPMAVSYSEHSDNYWKKKWLEELKQEGKLYKKIERGNKGNKKVGKNENLKTGTYYIKLEFPERLPSNLIVIGTVNMDETTYAFSPKVLDRANTIEFVSVDLGRFENSSKSSSIALESGFDEIKKELCSKGKNWRDKLWGKDEFKEFIKKKEDIKRKLKNINNILAKRNFHFGY